MGLLWLSPTHILSNTRLSACCIKPFVISGVPTAIPKPWISPCLGEQPSFWGKSEWCITTHYSLQYSVTNHRLTWQLLFINWFRVTISFLSIPFNLYYKFTVTLPPFLKLYLWKYRFACWTKVRGACCCPSCTTSKRLAVRPNLIFQACTGCPFTFYAWPCWFKGSVV